MERCILVFLLICFTRCGQNEEQRIQRSFYYWKSVFKLSEKESSALKDHKIEKLYIRFFDIVTDKGTGKAKPVASIIFPQKPAEPPEIIPVIFIANQVFEKTDTAAVDTLALKAAKLAKDILATNDLKPPAELQLDCDWTASTKERFFRFITSFRQYYAAPVVLSVTIRLHQVKYSLRTGIPPADKGLLMAYNMGNLTNPATRNSILDMRDLAGYGSHINNYPLRLDLGLPIFDWYAWFRNDRFHGLVRPSALPGSTGSIVFEKDTAIGGYQFKRNDRLRYEPSTPSEVKEAALYLKNRISSQEVNVVLFHLDEYHLNKFTADEIEAVFAVFR